MHRNPTPGTTSDAAGFATLHLHRDLLSGVTELGFVRPTPIQADAIPPALSGRDVLACAMTGSGKTAAFLLPILHQLLRHPRDAKNATTRALVLTPTRELATQIVDELNALATHTPITAAAVIGGVGMGPQEHAFRSGVDVIVATPGRLLDHLSHSYARLDRVEHLVLDEADRMLDMGFLPDIKRVLSRLPAQRQTLLFSATMPGPIRELSASMMRNPAMINLERRSAPAVGITQAVYPVSQHLKSALLLALVQRDVMQQALVFTRTKHRANRLWELLDKAGVSAARIHGRRSQAQRTDALDRFKAGHYRVLVATDIAARGIDITALGHVVNFDVPAAPEDYIHRVGRTARAETTGEAFTFAAPEESGELRAIERAIGKALPRVTLPDFDYAAKQTTRLEIPIAERIAAIRAQRATARARAKEKEERRTAGANNRGRDTAFSDARAGTAHAGRGAPAHRGSSAPSPTSHARRPDGSAPSGRRRRGGGRSRPPQGRGGSR
jgi:ATP-dependent RNA helicase RhlE